MRSRKLNYKTVSQLAAIFALATLLPVAAQCQTGVQFKLTDQGFHQPAQAQQANVREQANRVVLTSGTFLLPQESDFLPKDSTADSEIVIPQSKNPSDTLESDSPMPQRDQEEAKQDANELKLKDPTRSLDSDSPVKPPTFNLSDGESNEAIKTPVTSNNDRNQSDSDGYRLPPVGNVNSPISATPLSNLAQADSSGLLADGLNGNTIRYGVDNGMSYSRLTGKASQAKYKTWQAHNFYHRPLYFEQPNAERYGNHRAFNNVTSAVHFFSTIPQLPGKIGDQSPYQKTFTHGQSRPGDYTKYQIRSPAQTRRGTILQTLTSAAFLLP